MSKYDTGFKLAVVQEYLQNVGKRRVANRYRIRPSDVIKWALAYQIKGLPSLQKRIQRQYTPEFKLAVLQYMHDQQVPVTLAAAQFNIASPSTIAVWQRFYSEGGITALQPKPKGPPLKFKPKDIKALLAKTLTELTHEELLRKAQYLEMENAYLKNLEALAQKKHLENKNKSM